MIIKVRHFDPVYKFRLTFSHLNPGFFGLDCQAFGIELSNKVRVELYPRDSNYLETANRFHIDSGGFESESEALTAGEYLRTRLRLINSILDLGLNIPIDDCKTGTVSDVVKKTAQEKGGNILDPRKGLFAIPDDGFHFEAVTTGHFNVTPSDPIFLFDAAKKIWDVEIAFDARAEEVIELLSLSSREQSNKLKFLTAYLALEQMIKIQDRSNEAKDLITSFIDQTNASELSENEKASLIGSLSNLKRGSFSGAFKSVSKTITSEKKFEGLNAEELASKCIDLRNKIAHKADVGKDEDMVPLIKGIRELTHGLLWSEYKLADVSIYRPADNVSSSGLEIRLL